jgi:uncharacterized membrane protein YidH (DUF202 family)
MYPKTLLFLASVIIATTTITYSCLATSPFNQIFAQQPQSQTRHLSQTLMQKQVMAILVVIVTITIPIL